MHNSYEAMSPSSNGNLWPAAPLFFFSALLVLSANAMDGDLNAFLVGFCCFISMVIVLFPILVSRTETILSPIYFLAIIVFISMPVRFFVICFFKDLQYTHWFLASHSVGDFLVGAVMTVLGLCCVTITYLVTTATIRLPKALIVTYDAISTKRLVVVAILLFPIAIFAIWLGIERSGTDDLSAKRGVVDDGVRYADAYWSLIVQFARFAALLLFCILLKRGKLFSALGLLTLIGLTIPLFHAFTSQVRAGIILSLLSFLILFFGVRGRIPWFKVSVLGCLTAIVFVAMTEIRISQQGESLSSRMLGELSVAERFLISTGGAFNMGGFVANTMTYDAFPSRMDYQYGKSVAELVVRPIPRRFWPEKPLSLDFILLDLFRGMGTHASGGAPVGLIAEGYLNFGWFGVVLFSAIFGFVLKIYSNSVIPFVSNSPVALVFVSVWNISLTDRIFGYDVVSGMVQLISALVFIVFLGKIASLRNSS